MNGGKLRGANDPSAISELDVIDICVPTPLRKTKDPDLTFVISATDAVAAHLHPGMLVLLESTTYQGTTNELVLPRLQQSRLIVGSYFFLCFSPERIDLGNPTYRIPKVVGGITPACTELGCLLYRQALESFVPVSSTKVAEMVSYSRTPSE